jgi:hypothetical protein
LLFMSGFLDEQHQAGRPKSSRNGTVQHVLHARLVRGGALDEGHRPAPDIRPHAHAGCYAGLRQTLLEHLLRGAQA